MLNYDLSICLKISPTIPVNPLLTTNTAVAIKYLSIGTTITIVKNKFIVIDIYFIITIAITLAFNVVINFVIGVIIVIIIKLLIRIPIFLAFLFPISITFTIPRVLLFLFKLGGTPFFIAPLP